VTADALARLMEDREAICGSESPAVLVGPDGRQWASGDCWCTLPPEHREELCVCEPCRDRFGAPGWRAER
jgi:hypothetical protein